MDLMHNQVIHILDGDKEGIYRVILDEPRLNKTALVRLSAEEPRGTAGRRRLNVTKRPRKKSPAALVGALIWTDREELKSLFKDALLVFIVIQLEKKYFAGATNTTAQKIATRRKEVMADFLNYEKLRESLLTKGGLGGLVDAAVLATGASRGLVYKLWSILCRLGISERSLLPRHDLCGAPGQNRPCDPGGRKKPGRKSTMERLTKLAGNQLPPMQAGISSEWRRLILLADRKISSPKPKFFDRHKQILESKFVREYLVKDGKRIAVYPPQGEFPNLQQVRRVLKIEIPRLQRLLDSTTRGHYQRSMRGMIARNYKGVSGPGHTWAIDSTIADIYLRSSINRAWLIGRPIVYIIVDVWSTAIVGFYVCLMGPKWETAKISLFSAAADPNLLADLWQYQPLLTLNPAPSLPAVLLCDRGEYLSRAASVTGLRLLPCLSYTPPYRPDLKGLVEVLHRCEKDRQYLWVPGAIDARRKEYELRKFNPNDGVFTVQEYVHYLYRIFSEYNLIADRKKRLDTHMIAAGVMPSPAGLWRWGHEMGIGTRRYFPESELIANLLPMEQGRVARDGVRFSGLHYESEQVNEEQWTAFARNFGSWKINAHYFPGSVSRIWTPNTVGTGLMDLKLSQQTRASSEQTFDEVLDAFAIGNMSNADLEHFKTLQALKSREDINTLIESASSLTKEALEKNTGAVPSILESRKIEINLESPVEPDAPQVNDVEPSEADETYLNMMKSLFSSGNSAGEQS
jgi:putative transposase